MESLPLKVFRQYFVRMVNAVQENPLSLAATFHSKDIIDYDTLRAVDGSGLTFYQQIRILLLGVEQTVATSKDASKTLMEFCRVLSTIEYLGPLSEQIMQTYG